LLTRNEAGFMTKQHRIAALTGAFFASATWMRAISGKRVDLSAEQVTDPGEMAALTRAFDWASTPLGAQAQWPEALRTAVGMILESNHPMFIWWGPELIQFYNDAYRRTLGPERHPSALGQRGRECWQEAWSIIGPQIESVIAGGPATWHEDQLVPLTRHGRREDVWWTYGYSGIPMDGRIAGVLVVCTDVTDRHNATVELVRLNQRLGEEVAHRRYENERQNSMFEQAPGFICILRGPDHVFDFANHAYMRLIGQRELIGKPVRLAVPEASGQGFFELLDEVYRTGQPFFAHDLPIQLQHTPGAPLVERFLDFVYQPIIEADGSVSGIFVQGSDVTERNVALDALREADRRKDEFLAMLAHELRNPLAPISAAAEMLKFATLDAHSVHTASDIISRQVSHMASLVDDLLDIARVSRGQITLDMQSVDLKALLSEAIEQVRPLIKAREHQFEAQLSDETLRVIGDRKRLVQVISSLLNNAAKYTPTGGTVSVRLAANPEETISLEVRDNGIGIDAELLPRVFELFTQGNRSADRGQGGLGIGLALVKGIVDLHGGSVEASSAGANAGSQFTLTLPRHRDPDPGVAADTTALATHAAIPLRILIVDDNVDAAMMLSLLLGIVGHVANVESNPHAALKRIDAEPIDVCLLDIGLPGMDGNELARHIRQTPTGQRVVLIAVTGYGQETARQASREAGFDHYFVKPVETDALIELLAGLAERSSRG
jgi:signal transduction histidine kinase/ActR/RegA family two-component response regulator